jgi:hypothetical protein
MAPVSHAPRQARVVLKVYVVALGTLARRVRKAYATLRPVRAGSVERARTRPSYLVVARDSNARHGAYPLGGLLPAMWGVRNTILITGFVRCHHVHVA